MSFFTTLENDLAAVQKWFSGNPVTAAIEADFKAALADLEKIGIAELENAVKVIGLQVLGALATGGSTAAITAGVAAAETEFKALGKDLAAKTINTLVTTVVNQVSVGTTPAPVTTPLA